MGVVLLRHIPPGSKRDSAEAQCRDNIDGDDTASGRIRHFAVAMLARSHSEAPPYQQMLTL